MQRLVKEILVTSDWHKTLIGLNITRVTKAVSLLAAKFKRHGRIKGFLLNVLEIYQGATK